MYAVILAGGKVTPENELWYECGGLPKALIDINGKPMLQWVIDAVNQSQSISKIIIAGIESTSLINSEKPMQFLSDHGGIFENLSAAAKKISTESPNDQYFLSISSDIPFLTSEIVDSLTRNVNSPGYDIFYNVVEKKVMEKKFHGVKRTYMKFSDGRFCGGDMHLVGLGAIARPVVDSFVKYRKSPFKLISLIGFSTLLRMVFFPVSLQKGSEIVQKKTGITAVTVNCKFAELAMDIDNLDHLAFARNNLTKNNGQ